MGIGVWTWVFAAGGLVLAAVALILLLRRRMPAKGGQSGANGASAAPAVEAMRGFARSNRFRLIAPAQFGGQAPGLSAVMVGYFGVLGLIALGYNGQVYGSAAEKTWVQVDAAGNRNLFDNPMQQASAAVRAIRDVLVQAKINRKVPVEVVCVFTSPSVQLALPRSTGHLRVKEFKALLRNDKYLEDCGLDLDATEAALKAAAGQGGGK